MPIQLEELLEHTMGADAGGQYQPDGWASVERAVLRRHRLRAWTMRAFVGVCLAAATFSTLGVDVASTVASSEPAGSEAIVGEPRWWPTNADRMTEWTPQPATHWWLKNLIGLALPLLVGWLTCFLAPRHMRGAHRSQRWTRLGVGLHSVATAALVVSLLCGVGLLFSYNPLAVAMNNSLAMAIVGLSARLALYGTLLSVFAMFRAIGSPGIWPTVASYLVVGLAAQLISAFVRGIARNMVIWDQVLTESPGAPPTGLWLSMFGNQQLLGVEVSNQQSLAALGVALLVMVGALGWWVTRRLALAARAGSPPWASISDRLRSVPARSRVGALLLVAGLGLPIVLYLPTLQAVDATVGEVPIPQGWHTDSNRKQVILPEPWAILKTQKVGVPNEARGLPSGSTAYLDNGIAQVVGSLEERGFVPYTRRVGEFRPPLGDGRREVGEFRREVDSGIGAQRLIIIADWSDAEFGPHMSVEAGVFDNDAASIAQIAAVPGLIMALTGLVLLRRRTNPSPPVD